MIHQTFEPSRIPAAGTDVAMLGVETVYCDEYGAPKHSKIVSLLRYFKASRSDRAGGPQQAA